MSEHINIDELEQVAAQAAGPQLGGANFTMAELKFRATFDPMTVLTLINQLRALGDRAMHLERRLSDSNGEVLRLQGAQQHALELQAGHDEAVMRAQALEQERDALAAKLKALEQQEPVAWRKRIEFENGSEEWKFCAFPVLSKAEPLFASPAPAESSKWEGAEEWMPLAYHLCAEECGEDACHDLIWEGGPIPEPWGDRWMKYEDVAKDMIAAVRKFVPAEPVNARLLDIATGKLSHLYAGLCPDSSSGTRSLDPECPACRAIAAAEAQQAEPVRLTENEICAITLRQHDSALSLAHAIEAAVLRKNGIEVAE